MKEIIVEGYDLSKQNFKGMTPEQYLNLMKFQNFTKIMKISKNLNLNALKPEQQKKQ